MLIRVNDLIDSGTTHFVSRLENIQYCPRNYRPRHELREFAMRTERNDVALLSTSPDVDGLLQALL